jgi:MFS family permease
MSKAAEVGFMSGVAASDKAFTDQSPIAGHVAARIDRLPLTRVQWALAILVEITWGLIIVDTDGIGARLYPFVWKPNHVISVLQYGVIQALQVGIGVLLGSYIMSWVASRFGRRPAIILSVVLGGLFLWPFIYVTNFWGLVVLSVLSTLGVGGIVATHAVYLSEMIGPDVRSRVLLASQAVTALVGIAISLLAFWLIPNQWQLFIWISTALLIVVMLPLLLWQLPESPRWLEAMGRHAEAEATVAEFERRTRKVSKAPLPEPSVGQHPVVLAEQNTWRELFTNPRYRSRVLPLIVCWMFGYAGIVYGVGAFAGVYMVDHGGSPHFVFSVFTIAYAFVFLGFLANSWLRDRIERRDTILLMTIAFSIAMVVMYFFPSKSMMATAFTVARIGTFLWLFNMYNYTAVAFPTRIRSVAFAWTDGLGHLGAWAGVTLIGLLYGLGPNHLGWFLFIILPGALLPGVLIRAFGIKQAGVVLEQVST